jgi:hypothetical protein
VLAKVDHNQPEEARTDGEDKSWRRSACATRAVELQRQFRVELAQNHNAHAAQRLVS